MAGSAPGRGPLRIIGKKIISLEQNAKGAVKHLVPGQPQAILANLKVWELSRPRRWSILPGRP